MTEHTPGPWQVHEAKHVDGEYWASIGQATGWGPITDIVGEEGNHTEYFQPVAGMKYLVTPVAEQKANACLIAAAPELLEALEGANKLLWQEGFTISQPEVAAIEIAIAKAQRES